MVNFDHHPRIDEPPVCVCDRPDPDPIGECRGCARPYKPRFVLLRAQWRQWLGMGTDVATTVAFEDITEAGPLEVVPRRPPAPPQPEPTPWIHRYPWLVMRGGRKIWTDEDGRRFYVDQWGHHIYEWPDSEVEPGEMVRWQAAKIRAKAKEEQ